MPCRRSQDNAERGRDDSEDASSQVAWQRARLRYAVTPRFAVTSSEAQLKVAGELLKSLPGALMQTHLSESLGEIAWREALVPDDEDYTAVYDRFGLLGTASLFAHGIHLSERECQRLPRDGHRPSPIARPRTLFWAPG